ncbi:MAG: DHA2 family efflux MFS transporter permease subunit [Alphaproteobacteria bacterium]|nr:DHA2 family efflux MFS transporter permease subunit [Alphaproteobacteria bacterium]
MANPAIEAMFARFGPNYRYYVSFTAMLGTMSMVLTATIINVAIPVIMGAFGVGQDTVHWLSTGFIAAMTVSMLLNDWCVRAFGMRATYIGAMSVFIFGAVLGGLSNSIDMMIIGRILQGSGAGLVQPLAMVLMFQVFPVNQRGRAMGIFGVGIIVAPAFGPTFGGVLLDAFNWHYVFFMSAPVAAVGIMLAMIFMPGAKQERPLPPFDWVGLILVISFVSCTLTGLSNGQREGWGAPVIALLFSIAVISFAAFIIWELRTQNPILELRVFLSRKFAAAVLVGMVLSVGLFGSTYIIPLFVQTVQGYSPTRSGLLLMPGGLLMMAMFPIAGRLSDRLPGYQMILFGLAVFGTSCILMMQAHTDTPFWVFAVWIMFGRVGLASMMPTLTVTAVSTLKPELLSQGSGALNFSRQLGGAVGVNVLALILGQRTAFFSDAFAGLQTPDNSATLHLISQFGRILGQLGWPFEMMPAGALYLVGRSIYSQASMMAFSDAFLFMALLYFVTMIPALFLIDLPIKAKLPIILRPRHG